MDCKGLRFPKPVRDKKKRLQGLSRIGARARRLREAGPDPLPPPDGLAFPKPKPVVNEKLLADLARKPCMACGGKFHVSAHHFIKRRFLRLDVPEGTGPLCADCHDQADNDPEVNARMFLYYKSKADHDKLRRRCPDAPLWRAVEDFMKKEGKTHG